MFLLNSDDREYLYKGVFELKNLREFDMETKYVNN